MTKLASGVSGLAEKVMGSVIRRWVSKDKHAKARQCFQECFSAAVGSKLWLSDCNGCTTVCTVASSTHTLRQCTSRPRLSYMYTYFFWAAAKNCSLCKSLTSLTVSFTWTNRRVRVGSSSLQRALCDASVPCLHHANFPACHGQVPEISAVLACFVQHMANTACLQEVM